MNDQPENFDVTTTPAVKRTRLQFWKIALLVLIPTLSWGAWWLSQAIAQAREAARSSSCNCGLKMFGLALHNYHDHHGTFPPAFVLGPDGRPWHSWRVLILPYLDQQQLFADYRFDEPWDGPNNVKLLERMPRIYACPSRPCPIDFAKPPTLSIGVLACGGTPEAARRGYTSYAAVLGPHCAFPGTKAITMRDFPDGTSNTALVGECARTKIPWTKPEDIDVALFGALNDPNGFSSFHERGVYFLFGDGTVRFIRKHHDARQLEAIFTRDGRDSVQFLD